MKRNFLTGFTLIELIVVVIIVGILAAVAMPMMQNMKARAIATEAVMGVSAMRQAVKNYSIGYTGAMFIDLNVPSYFPIAVSASITPSDFAGTYFSQECYYGYKVSFGPVPALYGRCNFDNNKFDDRKAEIASLTDGPGAFIHIGKAGGIYQNKFKRSGYAEFYGSTGQ